jgi:hypothetical protein
MFFWLWFEFFYYFYKQNTKFTRNQDTFKNDKQKNMSCIGTTRSMYYKKLQKKLFQNSFVWKKNLGKKTCGLFLKWIVNSLYFVCTPLLNIRYVNMWSCFNYKLNICQYVIHFVMFMTNVMNMELWFVNMCCNF